MKYNRSELPTIIEDGLLESPATIHSLPVLTPIEIVLESNSSRSSQNSISGLSQFSFIEIKRSISGPNKDTNPLVVVFFVLLFALITFALCAVFSVADL